MKISATFDETQIKAFSLNFDKKLLRHIEKLKSPDKRIKKALLYFAKTGGKGSDLSCFIIWVHF